MSDVATIPPPDADLEIRPDEIGFRSMAPSLAILLNPSLYERAKAISVLMSRAVGMTPKHLIGQGEACFSVVTMALDWRLSWHFVARHTYQTPNGSIGFDGALVQSILEASGRFIGSPAFEYRGDWRVLAGKFRMQQSQRGPGSYPVIEWTDQDAVGLGIIVRWQVKGENTPRVWPGDDEPFWLVQCQPRNSPLWATDPKTQIRYLAIRRFANMAAPGILGAASFDREEMIEAADLARDITPEREPQRADYNLDFTAARPRQQQPQPVVHDVVEHFEVVALDGEVFAFETLDAAVDALRTVLAGARRGGAKMLEAAAENNEALLRQLGEAGAELLAEFQSPVPSTPVNRAEAPAPASPGQPGRATAPPPEATIGTPGTRESAPPPSQPPQAAAPPAAPAPATAAQVEDDRFPGDLPPGQRLGEAPPPTPAGAPPATSPGDGAASPAPTAEGGAHSPAGHGPTAPTAASPSEPTERKNLFINPPLSRGRPDYRTLVRALLIPKIRQAQTSDDLAYLLGDNADNIERARETLDRQDIAELDSAVEAGWARLRP